MPLLNIKKLYKAVDKTSMLNFLRYKITHLSSFISFMGILTCLSQSTSWAQGLALSPAPKEPSVTSKEAEKHPESTTSQETTTETPTETASNSAPADPTGPVSTPPALEPSTNTVTPNQIMPVELGPEALHQEMDLLKKLLESEGDGVAQNETVIIGEALKAPSRYHRYLLKAADISEELLSVREELLTDGGTMSLQQLGA